MTYVHANPSWKPAARRVGTGSRFLSVEWEPEPDQEFKLSAPERRAVLRGQKVLVR